MLNVRSAYHVTHMVKDLGSATRLYDKIFQPPIHFDGYHAGENRDASFASVSDAYIELFAPRDADSPDPRSNGARYIHRSGEGLCNFGWLVDNTIDDGIRFCEDRGYELVYVAGSEVIAFFIHPKQAHGMMLEIAGETIVDDPRHGSGWANRWRDVHPLGIERMNAVTYAVTDLDGAVGLLKDLTNAVLIHRDCNEAGDEESAFVSIADHVIEVRRGLDTNSEISQFIGSNGQRIHSVTFKVKDLSATINYLRELGLRVDEKKCGTRVSIHPADMIGARYDFTDCAIPSDPRLSTT